RNGRVAGRKFPIWFFCLDKSREMWNIERTRGEATWVMVEGRKGRTSGGVTAEKKAVFLATLAETCSVKAAAGAAGIATGYCYRLKLSDADFSAKWQEAI